MASLRARALSFFLRHTLKPYLEKNGADAGRARLGMEKGSDRFKLPTDVEVRQDTVAGVPGEWLELAEGRPRGNLLYLHGGGYFACSPVTHRPITSWFARAGLRVFAPDYRLAPEHPYPAAVEDVRAIWQALAEGHDPRTWLVGGDSAGGGLSLALLLAARGEGIALPAGAILFSPWTDLTVSGASVKTNERRCAMFTADMIPRGAGFYLDDADPEDPFASPLFGDLRGLPPLLIHVGEHECLLDDSRRLAERARAQGVAVELHSWPVVPHAWQVFHWLVPEGKASLRHASAFAERRLT